MDDPVSLTLERPTGTDRQEVRKRAAAAPHLSEGAADVSPKSAYEVTVNWRLSRWLQGIQVTTAGEINVNPHRRR
jgi:hypothetical protein